MSNIARIRTLNDVFRRSASGPQLVSGQLVVTRGVLERGEDFLARAILAVRSYAEFSADNDPYGEHDFGSFALQSEKLFWKIDLYEDPNVKDTVGSPVITRVMTIMLADEY